MIVAEILELLLIILFDNSLQGFRTWDYVFEGGEPYLLFLGRGSHEYVFSRIGFKIEGIGPVLTRPRPLPIKIKAFNNVTK